MEMPEDDTFVTYARSFQAGQPSASTLHQSCFPVDKMSKDLPLSRELGHSTYPRAPCPRGRISQGACGSLAAMPCALHLDV